MVSCPFRVDSTQLWHEKRNKARTKCVAPVFPAGSLSLVSHSRGCYNRLPKKPSIGAISAALSGRRGLGAGLHGTARTSPGARRAEHCRNGRRPDRPAGLAAPVAALAIGSTLGLGFTSAIRYTLGPLPWRNGRGRARGAARRRARPQSVRFGADSILPHWRYSPAAWRLAVLQRDDLGESEVSS